MSIINTEPLLVTVRIEERVRAINYEQVVYFINVEQVILTIYAEQLGGFDADRVVVGPLFLSRLVRRYPHGNRCHLQNGAIFRKTPGPTPSLASC